MRPQVLSKDPLSITIIASCVIGCALLALTPTNTLAEFFADPDRVQNLGRIPPATLAGALHLRVVAVVGACVWILGGIALHRMLLKMPESQRLSAFTRPAWLCILAAIMLGALLRMLHARESLWYDEISALVSFIRNGTGPILGNWFVPTNHVPQSLLSWWTVQAFGGISEWSLRFPMIAVGTLGIWFAALLGRELATPRAGVLCAFAMALCPIAVLEGAEARGYAIVITMSTAVCWCAARLAHTPTMRSALALALFGALATWAHPIASFLLIGIGAITLVRCFNRDVRAQNIVTLLACVLAAVTSAVLLAPLSGDFLATRADYARTHEGQLSIVSAEGLAFLRGIGGDWFDPYFLLTAFVLVLACTVASRARHMLLAVAIGVLLAIAASTCMETWIYARFLLFVVPATVLCIGVGADSILALTRGARRTIALALLYLLALAWIMRPLALPPKQPIRDAVARVAESAKQSKPTIIAIGLPDDAVGYYALASSIPSRASGVFGVDFARIIASNPAHHAVDGATDDATYAIVLYPDRIDATARATLTAQFERIDRLQGWADWGAGDVEVWRQIR